MNLSWEKAFLTTPGSFTLHSYIHLFMHQIYAEHVYKPGSELGTGAAINSQGPHNSVTERDS